MKKIYIRNNNDTDGIQFINIEVVRLDEITNADVGDDIIKDVVLEPKEKSSALLLETAGGTPRPERSQQGAKLPQQRGGTSSSPK